MRAIICDDDEIILKGLCSVIDWESLGVEIVGTAGDGKEGLRLLQEMQPQLLMSDIRMPHVDGLQLIEEGKRQNPELMAIVFSGYDDFAYARRALQLGVQDYLSKPIDMEELVRLVTGCVQRYDMAREDSYNERENLLRKLLMYEECGGRQMEEMERYNCMVLVIESEAGSRRMPEAADCMRAQGAYILTQKERRCEAAIVLPSRMSVEMQGNYCISRIRKLFEEAGLPVTCAVSSVRDGVREISRCYEEAHEALKMKYLRGENQNLHYGETQECRTGGDDGDILNTDLITPVKNGNMEQLEEKLAQLEERLLGMGMDSYLYMQFMVGNLYSSVLKELDQVGIGAELVFENPLDEYRKLIACDTIKKAMAVLRDNLGRVCAYVGSRKAGAYSKAVYKAIRYIGVHFNDPSLSMEEVAADAGLSPGRFSTLFKNETGTTFTEYLLKARMEKAKELMRNPSRKIYEVAMEAGYDNIPYFSTAFKKYTGCSPSEYRNLKKD